MTAAPVEWSGKRLLDLIAASCISIVLSPIAALVALWVRVDAGKPVLFKQERVGYAGQPFIMYKFRTMVANAVEVGLTEGVSEDPFGVIRNDPRFTKSGRFLRRTSLDELPQLFNVIRGDMSLIGPRPDIPQQVAFYSSADSLRLAARPGITGLAQVLGRDQVDWPTRISIDKDYIARMSFRLDMWVLLATVKEIFRSDADPLLDDQNARARRSPDC